MSLVVGGFAYFLGSVGLHSVSLALKSKATGSTVTKALCTLTSTKPTRTKPKKSSVYTRTGDKGESSLYNGERRSKTDVIFDALGHQDELNAILGLAIHECLASKNGLEPM